MDVKYFFHIKFCRDIVYGNGKAVEDLAQSHDHHLLKTGVQGVYTDKVNSEPPNTKSYTVFVLWSTSFAVNIRKKGGRYM